MKNNEIVTNSSNMFTQQYRSSESNMLKERVLILQFFKNLTWGRISAKSSPSIATLIMGKLGLTMEITKGRTWAEQV